MSDDVSNRADLRPTTAARRDARSITPPPLLERLLRRKTWLWIGIVGFAVYPWFWLIKGDPYALADPPQYLLDSAGTVATGFLVAVLMLSPLRVLFPTSGVVRALNRHRRLIGVTAFGFAVLHFGYFWLHVDGWAGFMKEIDKTFIWSGMAAWTTLAVLAITSLHSIVRAMGARGWKRLHRTAYLAAALAFYHQAAQQKEGISESLWFFLPLAILEVLRMVRRWMDAPGKATG